MARPRKNRLTMEDVGISIPELLDNMRRRIAELRGIPPERALEEVLDVDLSDFVARARKVTGVGYRPGAISRMRCENSMPLAFFILFCRLAASDAGQLLWPKGSPPPLDLRRSNGE